MKQYRSRKAGSNIIRTYNQLLKEWKIPVEELDIPTRYGKTHVNQCGNPQGKPVVLFHGVGDDSALMWLYNAKRLGEFYQLYAVDTMGGPGKSECGALYTKEFDDTLWIDDVLDGLKLQTASIIGVSHGGYMVQRYTVYRTSRVDQAISISSSIAAQVGRQKSPMKYMMKIFLPEALFPTDKNVIKLLRKMCGKNYHIFTENTLILEHYKWLLRGFNNMAMTYHKLDPFSGKELDIIKEKVRFLIGEEDPFQKIGGREIMLLHHAKGKFYPTAGHGLNHELADKVNEDILTLLSGQELITE